MAGVRRSLVRLHVPTDSTNPERQRKTQKLRERLTRERAVLARWQTRLRRAFNAVEKSQKQIARLEKQIANLEG
jgi:septal ring factor EnvC (AmiA/AmiB activator)